VKPSPTLIAVALAQSVPLALDPASAYRRTVALATRSVIGRDAVLNRRSQHARGIWYRDGRSPQLFRATANDPSISTGGNAGDFVDGSVTLPDPHAPGLPELLP